VGGRRLRGGGGEEEGWRVWEDARALKVVEERERERTTKTQIRKEQRKKKGGEERESPDAWGYRREYRARESSRLRGIVWKRG